MRSSSLVTTMALAGALALGAAPVFAQRGGGGHMGGGGGGHMGGGGGGHMGGGGGRMGGGGHVGGGHMSGGPGVPRGTAGVRGGTFNHGGWNVAPLHYFHPYYAFHPHFSLGFGLWAGYPVTWAYPYYYPPYPSYYYPYTYPHGPEGPGYSVAPPVDVTPGTAPEATNLGGLSFEITPPDAQVFVDGKYVGTAGQFTATTQPLGVPSGRHHVEIRSVGYQTMSFDVDIVAGEVIPYQGQMER